MGRQRAAATLQGPRRKPLNTPRQVTDSTLTSTYATCDRELVTPLSTCRAGGVATQHQTTDQARPVQDSCAVGGALTLRRALPVNPIRIGDKALTGCDESVWRRSESDPSGGRTRGRCGVYEQLRLLPK